VKNIYRNDFVRNWKNLFIWELISLFGRLFLSGKPPQKYRLLHLGCGNIYLEGFVNADFYYKIRIPLLRKSTKYDWLLDFRYKFKCDDDYWDGVFTEHTLEHLHYSDCLKLLKELHRTMKKGSYLRICVPSLESLIQQGNGKITAEAVYNLTENYGHVSVWDVDLMLEVLGDAGFTSMRKVDYLAGSDKRLLQDSIDRSKESLYVEAQK
jgi:predicted SAM-dependent methyltransferase